MEKDLLLHFLQRHLLSEFLNLPVALALVAAAVTAEAAAEWAWLAGSAVASAVAAAEWACRSLSRSPSWCQTLGSWWWPQAQ